MKSTLVTIFCFLSCCYPVVGQHGFPINPYYPIVDQNEWRYTAPEGCKDGDYVSRIQEVPSGFATLFDSIKGKDGKGLFYVSAKAKSFRHFDATKASKLLSVDEKGIFYHGETFSSDGSITVFEKPIHWFMANEKIGAKLDVKRNYTRFYKDGTTRAGIFAVTQEIAGIEDITVPAGNFKKCLRIEFDTYWDLGGGMEAKSSNIYHHAKEVGVVKASARFTILKNGVEITNRLVEPDLKSYELHESLIVVPNLERIKMATVVTKDVDFTKKLYRDWLDYEIVDEGVVSEPQANSWGTPTMISRPYVLLQSQSGDDVYLRVIEGTAPKNYRAMTTYGWNAIELIVKEPDAVYEKLLKSPFTHIGGPENLGGGLSTIRAVQFKGPSEEVFYFTTDTGDSSESTLLKPRTSVDRPFIMVLAGANARKMIDFYVTTFGAQEAFFMVTPIPLIASAQNLAGDYKFPLGLVRLNAFSNSIEIDEYSKNASVRPVTYGELPYGVSITSFTVNNLDMIDSRLFISEPVNLSNKGYDGNRTATIIGSAGELLELIEE